MGHANLFITGDRTWSLGHKPSREGIVSAVPVRGSAAPAPKTRSGDAIIGNRNSKVYHLAEGCPSYNKVSANNTVLFRSETEAAAAGYRKAGNCR